MKNEMVKYHNDFNKIQLPNFNELELNLLHTILFHLKEKGYKKTIKINVNDLKKFAIQKNIEKSEFTVIMRSLFHKFFKADFTVLIEDVESKRRGQMIVNLFEKAIFWYPYGDKEYRLLEDIELKVCEEFAYLVNDLTKNFTTFELSEFVALNSKYSKSLYCFLKQYRTQGIAPLQPMPMNEFRRILDIPDSYKMSDIDKQILKPAIKELSERTLLEPNRVAFKNLKYTKIKGSGRGRGGNVEAIQFTFAPEESIPVEAIAKAIEIKESKVDYNEKQEERKSYLKLDKNDIDTKIDILNAKFKNEFLYSKELDSILQVKKFDYDENNVIQLHFLNLNDEEDEKTIKMNYREALLKLPIMIKQYEKLMKDFEASETSSSDFKL